MKVSAIIKASALCLASAGTAFGAGFSLFEDSAAGIGNPTYGAAKGGEPGAQFANPAAIAGLKGTQVQIGVAAVTPSFEVEGTNPYTGEEMKSYAKKKMYFIPHAYLTHEINDELTLGVGFNARYGMGTAHKQDWFGRYNCYSSDMMTFGMTPVLAWQANDWLAISGGFTVQYFEITLKQKIDAANRTNNPNNPPALDVDQVMSADSFGYGANIGLVAKPVEGLAIGLAYHSRIKQSASGKAKYDKPPVVAGALAAQGMGGLFNDTGISGNITLPDTIVTAVTYDFNERLTLGIGVTLQTWSTYDELKIKFDEPVVGAYEVASKKDWNNALRYSVGGTYTLTDSWVVRASYIFDQSPSNSKYVDYIMPTGDRHILAFGLGYTTGAWTFDGAYFYEFVGDDKVPADPVHGLMPSEYVNGRARCFALSATRRF